jgi:hypothetical protein
MCAACEQGSMLVYLPAHLRLQPAGELCVFGVTGHRISSNVDGDPLDLLRVHLRPGGRPLRVPAAAPFSAAASLQYG